MVYWRVANHEFVGSIAFDTMQSVTRPWLHGCETEEYTDKYINKFSEDNTNE